MKKTVKPIAPLIAAASVLGLTACAQTAPTIPDVISVRNVENSVITVQSSEEIKVVPDMAEIVLAVTSEAATAKACQEQNTKDLSSAIDLLKGSGVDEKSIQTSNYGLDPVYDWNSGQTITGYRMRTTLTVSDLPLDQVGTLLTACVDAGVNNIESVSYLSSQYDASYQEALKNAMAAAKQKAEVLAEASECTLVGISHVEEYASNQQVRYTGMRSSNAADTAGAMAKTMDVEPGQISIEARISVDFLIQ